MFLLWGIKVGKLKVSKETKSKSNLSLSYFLKVCYNVRNAESFFNEAKYISWSIYNIAAVNILMILIQWVFFCSMNSLRTKFANKFEHQRKEFVLLLFLYADQYDGRMMAASDKKCVHKLRLSLLSQACADVRCASCHSVVCTTEKERERTSSYYTEKERKWERGSIKTTPQFTIGRSEQNSQILSKVTFWRRPIGWSATANFYFHRSKTGCRLNFVKKRNEKKIKSRISILYALVGINLIEEEAEKELSIENRKLKTFSI